MVVVGEPGRSYLLRQWRLRGKPFFDFRFQIGVLGLEVLEESGGIGGTIVLE